jgi:stage II sporulation protein D
MIFAPISFSKLKTKISVQKKNLLFLLIISLLLSGCASTEKFSSKSSAESSLFKSEVRVLLNEQGNSFSFKAASTLNLFDENFRKIAEIRKGNTLHFAVSKSGITLTINKKNYQKKFFILSAAESQTLTIQNKKYKGFVKISGNGNKLLTVNHLTLDDYLKGVLPSEMPAGKGNDYFEALKAFAISARTFTLKKIEQSRYKDFDLHSDVRDQVYGGASGEKEIFNRAIHETSNLILAYNNSTASIFYHSTCGGYTEAVANVFSGDPVPYITGVKDGEISFCSISPRYEWEEIFSADEIVKRLFNASLINHQNFTLNNIEVISRFPSGRVNELRITLSDKAGKKEAVKIFGNNIRFVIRNAGNNGILRSNFFDVHQSALNIIIKGKGAGHGAGMCQWGAIYMSTAGKNYKEIIAHYFPSLKIKKLK